MAQWGLLDATRKTGVQPNEGGKECELLAGDNKRKLFGVMGIAMICWGVMQLSLWIQFTPVYRATSCGHQEAELKSFGWVGAKIKVNLEITVHCWNPNPYEVDILSSTPGRVLVGAVAGEKLQTNTAIGHLEVVPGSSLPIRGKGVVRVNMHAVLSAEDSNQLLPEFLADSAVPILLELRFKVGITLNFGLGSWGATAPFDKACGLNMMGVLVNQFVSAQDMGSESRLGPLVCRDSFKGMVIPPVGEAPKNGKMGFSAAQVAPNEVEAGEFAKNISLASACSGCFLTAAVLLYSAWYGTAPPMLTGCYESCQKKFAGDATLPTISDVSVKMSSPGYDSPLKASKVSFDESEAAPGAWKRPRNQADLSSTDSQAMLLAAGGRDSDEESKAADYASQKRDISRNSRTLLPPDARLSSMSLSSDHSSSPRRQSRILPEDHRGRAMSQSSGRKVGEVGRSSSPHPRDDERSIKSRSPSQGMRRSSPAYLSSDEGGAPEPPEPPPETLGFTAR
ncbi:unnamed protein product [Effrenium voratum]|nr:unnamed protein product [Effrenium voratum]